MTEIGTHLAAHEDRAPSMEASPLMRALDMGVDADTIERLVALQERAEARAARAAFFAALAAFQAEVGPVPKTDRITVERNGIAQTRSTFAPLHMIATHIRPALARHGLAYSWDSTVDGERFRVICTVRHIDGHEQTASFEAATKDAMAPGMSGIQIAGSARTYGERYSLIQALGLTTADVDDDGQAPGSGEPITDEQLADLDALITEVGADRTKFLAWLRVGKLADLPASQYQVAKNALEAKR